MTKVKTKPGLLLLFDENIGAGFKREVQQPTGTPPQGFESEGLDAADD